LEKRLRNYYSFAKRFLGLCKDIEKKKGGEECVSEERGNTHKGYSKEGKSRPSAQDCSGRIEFRGLSTDLRQNELLNGPKVQRDGKPKVSKEARTDWEVPAVIWYE